MDYRDRLGRLIFRVWSYETDGHADQLTYSASDGYEPQALIHNDALSGLSPVSQS